MSADTRPGDLQLEDSEAIRSNIEATRQRMGDTLEQLSSRLNPGYLKQQAKDKLREATIGRVQNMGRTTVDKASSAGRGIVDVVRENPIPSALIALGAGWLALSARRGNPSNSEAIVDVQSSPYAEPGLDEARTYRTDGDSSRRNDTGLADKAKEKANAAANLFEQRPLVVGVIAAAIGLAVGSAIPPTQKEAELVGEKRDQLLDKARDVVSEKKEQVKRVGQRVVTEAKEAATQAAREEGLTGAS
ncbi:MAG: DUF3618 domain-containing protein [Gemmatimonadaceae bacterium]